MLELTPQQVAVLERLVSHGFHLVAFPLYASALGVRKGNCAALLVPVASVGLRLHSGPCYLVEGNLSVRIQRESKHWFVWKKTELEATPERLEELHRFAEELETHLSAAL